MNIKYWITALTVSVTMLSFSAGAATAQVQPSGPSSVNAAAAKTAATPKKTKKKRSTKKLSKASRSAFEPAKINQALTRQSAKAHAADGLASAMGQDTSAGLRESAPATVAAPAPSPFSMTLTDQGVLSGDVDAPTLPEGAADVSPDDQVVDLSSADVFGEQKVSVIDRFSDKPKAKAIANGPLRLRMHDKALRASVQIPIAGN